MKTTQPTKTKLSTRQKIDWIAKAGAYVFLVLLASYGLRSMLASLDERANMVITVFVVLGLIYILTVKQEA